MADPYYTSAHLAALQAAGSGSVVLARPGTLSVAAGSVRYPVVRPLTIAGVRALVGTAPTTRPVTIDVNRNGSTIFTTQANRPSIAAAANASSETVPDVTSLVAGDYLTVDVDAIGASGQVISQVVTTVPARGFTNGVSVARPAGAQVGDIFLVALFINDKTLTIATPAGWTAIGDLGHSTDTLRVWYAWRRDDGAAGPWSFTGVTSATWSGYAISAYRGAALTGSPIAASAFAETVFNNFLDTPSVAPVGTDNMLVAMSHFPSGVTPTPAAGLTLRTGTPSSAFVADQNLGASSSATGAKHTTLSGSVNSINGAILLKPEPVVGQGIDLSVALRLA